MANDMPKSPTPERILQINRQRSAALVEKHGVAPTRKLLEKAAKDLERRILAKQALLTDPEDSFSYVQLRVLLHHVREVLRPLQSGMKTVLTSNAKTIAEASASGALQYLKAAEKKFTGINKPLATPEAMILDASVDAARGSLLRRIASDPDHPGQPGVLARYSAGVLSDFEKTLQLRVLAQTPWGNVRDKLVEQSPFLQGKPAHWAERIARNECMFVANVANHTAIEQAAEQFDDMVKILFCPMDSRTGSDSIAVHGQVRRISQPFDTWFGPRMNPPDRPNDRATVLPARLSWSIPPSLKPLPDSAVLARWRLEGRKGAPPPRPLLSTVDLEQSEKRRAG